jgi:hypothetical protein
MAGNDSVKIDVRSELDKVIADLKKISGAAKTTSREMSDMGKKVGEESEKQIKHVESQVSKISGVMRRALQVLKDDFKTLVAVESTLAGFKLSEQFRGSVKQTMELGNQIRKLGATFGIAAKDFGAFQSKLLKGLGEVGLGSESATKALEGLSETPVRGQENLMAYSKSAGMLAGAAGEKGQEGTIAKGMSDVIQARGGLVNDVKQMQAVADDLSKVFQATGMKPSQALGAMSQMFQGMSPEFAKKMSTRQMAVMAAGAHAAGPGATQFIQDFMQKGAISGAFQRVMGQTKLFDEKGFNTKAIKEFYETAKKMGGGDILIGLRSMGIESDDAAKGFVRLAEHLDEVSKAQEDVSSNSRDLATAYEENMTAGEAWEANLNRVKKFLSSPISMFQEGAKNVLGKTAHSDVASAAVTVGGGALTTLMMGGGLNHLLSKIPGGGLIGGMAKEKMAEEMGIQKVFVVNMPEEGLLGGGKSGIMGMLGKAGMVGAAGVAGYEIGDKAINPLLDKYTQGKNDDGMEGNAVERFFAKLDQWSGYKMSGTAQFHQQKVVTEVHINEGQLKKVKNTMRGGTN